MILRVSVAALLVLIINGSSIAYGQPSHFLVNDGLKVDDLTTALGDKTLSLTQDIVRVSARSSCGSMVTARCPRGYELVGGGIDMDSVKFDGDTCTSWNNHINNEFFLHSFVSKPNSRTSGWKCRADDRKVDCYAMCVQRNSDGISDTTRKRKHIEGQNSDCGESCQSSAYRSCPPGYTVLGGGMEITAAWEYQNEPCCDETDVEELKRDFGYYVSGHGVQCNAKSRDHWGNCYALCVSNAQLANVDVVIKSLSPESEKSTSVCSSVQDLIGCGFSIEDGANDRITKIKCNPDEGANKARCRVKAVSHSQDIFPWAIDDNEIKCQAYCLGF